MGGAIFNLGGTVDITDSTFTGNSAIGGTVGAYGPGQVGSGLGGAIFNCDGVLTVTNSTTSGNTAAQGGSGIYAYGADVSVSGVRTEATVTLFPVNLTDYASTGNVTLIVVPEPGSATLLILGGVGALLRRRRK